MMQITRKISITPRVSIGGEAETFTLIAGPCAIEDETTVMTAAEGLKRVCEELEIPLVFKGSFDKANRSSIFSPRGVMEILWVVFIIKRIGGLSQK